MWVPGRSSSFPLPPLPHTWYDLISEQPVCGGCDALAGGQVLTTSEASACLAYWTGSQSGSLWVEDIVYRIKTWYEPTSEHLESFIITVSMLNEWIIAFPSPSNHDLYCIAVFSFTCFECKMQDLPSVISINRTASLFLPLAVLWEWKDNTTTCWATANARGRLLPLRRRDNSSKLSLHSGARRTHTHNITRWRLSYKSFEVKIAGEHICHSNYDAYNYSISGCPCQMIGARCHRL